MPVQTRLRNITLLISSTLTVMAGAIIAPALPEISQAFSHLPDAELLSKLILTLPALVIAMLAPVAGYFTDRSGRRRVLLFSLVLYALAGTTGAYLSDIYLILVGRAFLGMAVGALMTAVVTLIGDYFEGEERSRFMGYQAAFAGVGGLFFIAGGGLLADISWRAPFWIYGFSLLVMLLAWLFVPEPARPAHSAPARPAHPAPSRSASQAPARPESHAPARSTPPKTDASGHKTGPAAIPPKVYLVYLIAFFSMAVFYMIPVQMPFMLSALDGVSSTGVGFAIAFMNVTAVTAALNYGRVKQRLSFGGVMALVYFLIAAGYIIISRSTAYWEMVAGILVSGLGFGMQMANLNLWLVSLAPPPIRGRLVGYLNSAIFLGMFLSPILLQPLIQISNLYTSFFLTALILLVLGGVFCYFSCSRFRTS
jgi:MFS family permease